MGRVILFILLASGFAAQCDELVVGSVTNHWSGSGKYYKYQVGNEGKLIFNPMLAYKFMSYDEDTTVINKTIFGGLNSIGKPMLGFAMSQGMPFTSTLRVGPTLGVYVQDNRPFREKGYIMMSAFEYKGYAPMPVFGVEFVKLFNRRIKKYSTVNITLTPALLNVGLGVGF